MLPCLPACKFALWGRKISSDLLLLCEFIVTYYPRSFNPLEQIFVPNPSIFSSFGRCGGRNRRRRGRNGGDGRQRIGDVVRPPGAGNVDLAPFTVPSGSRTTSTSRAMSSLVSSFASSPSTMRAPSVVIRYMLSRFLTSSSETRPSMSVLSSAASTRCTAASWPLSRTGSLHRPQITRELSSRIRLLIFGPATVSGYALPAHSSTMPVASTT